MTPRPARLPGPPVRAVLFDYGGTLVTIERPEGALLQAYRAVEATLRRCLPAGAAVPTAVELVARVHDHVDAVVAEHEAMGTLDEIDLDPVYRNAYARMLGTPPGDDLLDELIRLEQRAWFDGLRLIPGAIPMLQALRDAGLRVGLCSNAPYHSAMLREQLEHVGIAGMLDAVSLSSDSGRRKPAPEPFTRALEELGNGAHEAVHIGDRLREDVEGAHSAGLRAVWFCGGDSRARARSDRSADGAPARSDPSAEFARARLRERPGAPLPSEAVMHLARAHARTREDALDTPDAIVDSLDDVVPLLLGGSPA